VREVKGMSNSSSSRGNLLHDDHQPRTFRLQGAVGTKLGVSGWGWHNLPCSLVRHRCYHQTIQKHR
jgi:hypothetical protein